MPYKDEATKREYHRQYMSRQRAKATPGPGTTPPASKDNAASLLSTQESTLAATSKKAEKCLWTDMNVCILDLTRDYKPIYCNGIKKTCEGSREDIKTLPFGPGWTGFRRP